MVLQQIRHRNLANVSREACLQNNKQYKVGFVCCNCCKYKPTRGYLRFGFDQNVIFMASSAIVKWIADFKQLFRMFVYFTLLS